MPTTAPLLRAAMLFAIVLVLKPQARAELPLQIYADRRIDPVVMKNATDLRDAGKLIGSDVLLPQLKTPKCKLKLPPLRKEKLAGRDLWASARQSYLRVGWFYLCSKCNRWHLDLAGGYVITADGVAVTCHHVAAPPDRFLKGFLIAATDDGRVLPVTQILAASAKSDVCIVRVKSESSLTPLPISDAGRPGDTVYCFSDPMSFRGYFSQGIINRYYRELPRRRDAKAGETLETQPLSLNVSTDWAPGSSGAAVIDECGNAIGHVARIMPVEEEPKKKKVKSAAEPNPGTQPPAGTQPKPEGQDSAHEDLGTLMVIHNAVPSQEVLALIDRE